MKVLRWIAINSLFVAMLYLGYVKGIDGFRNVFNAFTWFASIVSFAYFRKDVKERLQEKGKSVPLWVDNIFGFGIFGVLAYFGNFVLAGAYVFHIIANNYAYTKED
jgi:hypothetical protein